jgi:hypothetical protein
VILNIHPEYMEHGSASPGVCYFCHAARRPDEVVIDFHMQVDVAVFDGTAIDGWLQACSSCMSEVGRAIGMETADKVAALRAELALEQDRRATAEKALEEADRALDALTLVRARPGRISAEDDE